MTQDGRENPPAASSGPSDAEILEAWHNGELKVLPRLQLSYDLFMDEALSSLGYEKGVDYEVNSDDQ